MKKYLLIAALVGLAGCSVFHGAREMPPIQWQDPVHHVIAFQFSNGDTCGKVYWTDNAPPYRVDTLAFWVPDSDFWTLQDAKQYVMQHCKP